MSENKMLMKDCERKLNRLCTISITQESKWYEMLSRVPGTIQSRVYAKPDGVILQMFFLKNLLPQKFLPTLLANKNAIEKKDAVSITEPINNPDQITLIKDILNIPSAMISECYLLGNELNISFRFHSSVLEDVNRILDSRSMTESDSRMVYLGPSPGTVSIMNGINATTPLTVIRFTLRQPAILSDELVMADILGTQAEAQARMLLSEEVKLILYSDKELKWANPISTEELVYEAHNADSPFMHEIEVRCYKAMIPLLLLFGRITKQGLEMTTLIPSVESSEFLNLFREVSREFKGERPVLELYQSLTPDVWEWL